MSIEEEQWRLPELTPAEYAQLAIDIDQKWWKEENASHEFVKSLGCNRFLAYIPEDCPHGLLEVPPDNLDVGDYCHVSFIAKPINTTTDHDHDHDHKLIFAELLDRGRNEFTLNDRWILERNTPRVYQGCAFCPREEGYPHPKIGCAIGRSLYDHKHSIAASQSDLAARFKNFVLSLRNNTYKPQYTLHFTLPNLIFSPELSNDEFAMIALSSINDKEGANFELAETLGCLRQTLVVSGDYRDWCHVCLIAKPKKDDGSLVYFFAELSDPGVQKFSVGTYSRIDHGSSTKGCGICPEDENFLHPPIGSYTAGDFPPFTGGFTTSSDEEGGYCISLLDYFVM